MEKDEVRACLRALLSSSVFSYTLRSLLIDFRAMTGFELPLFGCSSPVEFLRTLTDTVQLIGDPLHPNPQVALVESKKSAHIISLVERQKTSASLRRHPGFLCRPKRLVIPDQSPTFNGAKESNVFSDSSLQRTFEATLHSNTFRFGSSFQNKFKELEPRPPVFTFQGNTISSQRQMPSPPLRAAENLLSGKSKSTPGEENKGIEKTKIEKCVESLEEKTVNSYFEENEDHFERIEDSRNNSDSVNDSVNEGIKNKFRKLIKHYPDGLWCCELPELFLKENNFVLDYREFGYTSLIQMLSELTDVFRCVRPGNEDWILFDASVPPGPMEKKMKDLELGAAISCEIRSNVKKVLVNCFENEYQIEPNRILDLYKEKFGSSLDLQSLGFTDFESLLKTWEGSFLNILKVHGKTFVVPALKRTPSSSIPWEEAVPPITEENDIFAEIFPKDVVGPNESPTELDLMRHVGVGMMVEVCIAEVWSPAQFYLQLNKFKTPLQRFMDDLQNFYNVHLNKYKMPDSTIRPNQMCVGLYNSDPESPEEWYRAQIVKVINEKTVLINFVDYGTLTRVKKSQLRFLHRKFQNLPVQGFLAQLSGVVPPNNESKWPVSTSKKFLELTRVDYLKAEITDIDFKIPRLTVKLFDPLNQSPVSINQKLVLEKLACLKEPAFEDPLQPPETETKLQDSNPVEKQNEVVGDKPSDESIHGNVTKNLPEQIDAFSDIDDLGQTTLFHFKMKRLSLTDSLPSQKNNGTDKALTGSKVSFEFEEVPDLEKDWKEEKKKVPEEKPKKEIPKSELFENEESSEYFKGAALIQQNVRKSNPRGEKKFNKPPPAREVVATGLPSVLSSKPNRLPPGLEHVNVLPSFNQVQFYLQPEEFKKRVNILAMELLTTKPSIKMVGMNNPALALEIATEMAEVYLASQYPGQVPYGLNSLSANSFPNGVVPPLQLQLNMFEAKEPALPNVADFSVPFPVMRPAETTIPKKQDFIHTQQEKPQTSPTGEKIDEYVKVKQIGNKTLHLITTDGQLYFSAEEIVRNFSLISCWEIADMILHRRKFQVNYRIITKSTDEEVLKAILSSGVIVYKGKLKRLKIYLIPVAQVVPFLQTLGCITHNFEKDFLELQFREKVDSKTGKEVS